jgi:hypothetical protein
LKCQLELYKRLQNFLWFTDGHLNGYCEANVIDCVDDNTTCQANKGVCECKKHFTEIDGVCNKGMLNIKLLIYVIICKRNSHIFFSEIVSKWKWKEYK